MAEVALGLDLGTSGVRVLAVTGEGEAVAEVNHPYPLLTPKPGWTEQDPTDWVNGSLAALREIAAKLETYTVTALGLSGQMHGMVPVGAQGEPLHHALLWNDQRTGGAVDEMLACVPKEAFITRTGNPPITGFQLCKLIWLRQSEPDIFRKTRHALLPKDYLGFALTGAMHSEPSDNSGTNCFHLASKRWDEMILGELELPTSLFPEVIASHEVTGTLTSAVAAKTGLPTGLPVVIGAGDNAAAAVGLGLSSRKQSLGSVSLGTSGVVFAPITEVTPDLEGRVHLFCHADGGYALTGVTLAAAGSLRWYRDTFAPDMPFDELVRQAQESDPGSRGVTFKPYLAGERTPHLNPDLRGSWTGLSLATSKADIIRSLLEGVAFSLREALEIIRPLTALDRALATGGGAASKIWLQLTSDVLELPLSQPKQNQGAAYGAALLAMQGVGQISDAVGVVETIAERTLEPRGFAPYQEAWVRYQG